MTYQAQFLRTGQLTARSELFETMQAAHAHVAQKLAGGAKPEVIAIVEIDDNGDQGRVHEIQVF
jgi:hypothetical protein